MSANPKHCLDLTGLKCPLPVLKTAKSLREMAPGCIIKVICTDPMSSIDLPHYCNQHNHILHQAEQREDGSLHFIIEKGSAHQKPSPQPE